MPLPEDKADSSHQGLFPSQDKLPANSYRELLLATVQQIRKDFYPHIDLPVLRSDFTPNDLREMLFMAVEGLWRDKPAVLEQIMYRVDLSENKKREAMARGLEELTEAILRREALKVWIRHNYSENM